jgi:hypothetical protein
MAHRVDPVQQPCQQHGVAHVTLDQVVSPGPRWRSTAVCLRHQSVQQHRLVPSVRQQIRHVRTDKTHAPGDQYPHPATIGPLRDIS